MAKRVLKWFLVGTTSVVLAATLAYGAVAGYHRAATPGLFGMTQAAPNLYIDDTTQIELVQKLVAQSEVKTKAFFGELRADPTFIICTTQACKDDFGLKPRGLSIGYHFILIDQIDDSALIYTHERIHAELHSFMSVSDLWKQRFPAWFDEGLASHISGDTRLKRPIDARDADWIRAAVGFRDWGRLHRSHNWQDTYGAAARLVQEIESQIGREGLLNLIKAVADGADFEETLAQMVD